MRLIYIFLISSFCILTPLAAIAQVDQPIFDDWFLITKDKKFRKPAGFVNASGSWVEVDGKRLYKLRKTQEIDTKFLLIRFDITSDEVAYYDEQGLLGAKIDFTRNDTVIEIVGKRNDGKFEVTQTTTKDGESSVKSFTKALDEVQYTSFDALKPLDISEWEVGTQKTENTFIFLKEEPIEFKYSSEGRRFESLKGKTSEVTVLTISGPQDSEVWYDNSGQRIAGKQRLGSFYRVDKQAADDWKQSNK